MSKLTDEEVGQLLRETFADKEGLLDQLPEATSTPVRRRKGPVLLAAAAVLVVLVGVVSVAGLNRGPSSEPAGASAASSTNGTPTPPNPSVAITAARPPVSLAYLSGVAIAELTKWERPAAGWPVVKVLDATYSQASSPIEVGGKGTPLSQQAQALIAASAVGVPIEWVQRRPKGDKVCEEADGTPYVTLGPVVMAKSGASATIGMSIWRGCMDAQWLTYRLVRDATQFSGAEASKQRWSVAGTVGPVAVS
ncbi:hypothetical protein GCM10009554_21180 [Kribbella koreensis]|uniref:Uncharacterized protein n=1 Tax=Kribbella koreensis TaxID=57909 RepID=A0ABN1PZB1_9ACTN